MRRNWAGVRGARCLIGLGNIRREGVECTLKWMNLGDSCSTVVLGVKRDSCCSYGEKFQDSLRM
jgi:hypothetical protein